MKIEDLESMVRGIVDEAREINNANTEVIDPPVNYVCIFSRSDDEYSELLEAAKQIGDIVKETKMGPVFKIKEIETSAGVLDILKVRRFDPKRLERGDADFTISDYPSFKKNNLGSSNWDLISRPDMEMLELSAPGANVLVYYSNPILAEVIGIK
jgi:hypothetical protein